MKSDKKIILASTSPRRKAVLERMGLKFDVCPSNFEEKLETNKFTYEAIENLALGKAKDVKEKFKNEKDVLIISADTVVVLEDEILCKPKDKNHAYSMLKSLSGKTHFVVTCICVLKSDSDDVNVLPTTTYVTFNQLTDEMINDYIEKFKPLDKAGAYGIQELPEGFVSSFEGDMENVIGLSSKSLTTLLNQC
ncbi:MAG: Maf family protein [bacterium]|nr:Maf family protein [bacterium]